MNNAIGAVRATALGRRLAGSSKLKNCLQFSKVHSTYVPHIRPRLSSNSRPPGQRTVDEWHYADTRCASGARRAADFPHHRHAGFPKGIVKTRAGLVMVHVTTTLRLAPTHPFLKSSPTKVSKLARREFFKETTST
jgi:hypothetical protein